MEGVLIILQKIFGLVNYQENKELVQVGAYQRGSDHHMDTALRTITQITDFLTQKMSEASSAEQSMTALRELIHEF